MSGKLRYREFVDRIDIDDLEAAIGFSPIREDRGNDIGHCIWPERHTHGDTTGKFSIHRDRHIYHCWGCGAGGSLLSLAMELYGFDVDEATHWLFQFASGSDNRTDAEFESYLLELIEDVEQRVETLPYFHERVLDRFTGPRDYFRERGIADQVIEDYNLCYSEMVMKPSPVKRGKDGPFKEDADYYGPAAIFPHYWQGRLVGWQHRWMAWDEEHTKTPKWLPKYTNTTDFPKDKTLFNYAMALKAQQKIVVVESVPTALFLASYNIPAVSYFGSKPTAIQLRLLRRFLQGVILAPDNDATGDTLVNSATPYLERYIPVYHAERVALGPKADLGDYAKTDDPYRNLRDHLAHRVHLNTEAL